MSWNDERIKTLKKMWSDGKSASEIADHLGNVTRNAVIGKAHRLGLSGRPSPIKNEKTGKKPASTPTSKKTTALSTKKPVSSSAPTKTSLKDKVKAILPSLRSSPSSAKKPEKSVLPPTKTPASPAKKLASQAAAPVQTKNKKNVEKQTTFIPEVDTTPLRPELNIDPSKLVHLLSLNERMCRWPVGDPKDPAFGFCGQPVVPGRLYCQGHVAMAYQISTKKADEKAAQRRKLAAAAKLAEEAELEDIEDVELEDIEDIDNHDDGTLDEEEEI